MHAYNLMIKISELLKVNKDIPKQDPIGFLDCIQTISNELKGTKISEFLSVFTPVKRYTEDDSWNYHSTLKEVESYGELFNDQNFKLLIMMNCYESQVPARVGLGYMMAVSALNERQTKRSIFDQFREKQKFNRKVRTKNHLHLVK